MKTEGLHIVRPRAAGLDVHKMEITATVRICRGEGEPVMETRVSASMALALEHIGWGTAEHWMRMQASYELAQARRQQTVGKTPAA